MLVAYVLGKTSYAKHAEFNEAKYKIKVRGGPDSGGGLVGEATGELLRVLFSQLGSRGRSPHHLTHYQKTNSKNYFPILPIMLKYCPCQRTRELEKGFTREFPFRRAFAVEKS